MQADVLYHSLPLMLKYAVSAGEHDVNSWDAGLELSRACSIVMLLSYLAYLFFQLMIHRQLFEPQEVCSVCMLLLIRYYLKPLT
jgi:Ca2+:H+ antiporter